MMLKFNSLLIFLSLVDVCRPCPITTPQFPGARDKLKSTLRLTKYVKKPDKLAALGDQYCREGKFKSAMKLFEIAIEKSEKTNNAEYYKMRGKCYRRTQKVEDLVLAIADFREAVRKDPNVLEYRLLLSYTLCDHDEFDEAVKETINTGLEPSDVVKVGNKLRYRRGYTQAIQCYSKAIDEMPENDEKASYYILRANCQKDNGSLKEAADDFAEAMKKAPSNETIPWQLTLTLFELGESEEALKVAFGMEWSQLFRMADYLYHELKFDEAIPCYSKLLIANTDNAPVYERRGFCYRRKGDLDAAITDYNEALRINSYCTSCRLALIDIYCWNLQKYDEAEAVLEKLDISRLSQKDLDRVEKAKNKIEEMKLNEVRAKLQDAGQPPTSGTRSE